MALSKNPFNPEYQKNYTEAEIDLHRVAELSLLCNKILANKTRYEKVAKLFSMPWEVIAAIHYRESSLDFKSVLHNGERIIGTNKKTTLVPAGHGPFQSWEDAAIDALKLKSKTMPSLWNTENELSFLEKYNGLGYKKKGLLSPYVWAGTTKHSEKGKYVQDGKFDPNAPEKQFGVVAILKFLRKK